MICTKINVIEHFNPDRQAMQDALRIVWAANPPKKEPKCQDHTSGAAFSSKAAPTSQEC